MSSVIFLLGKSLDLCRAELSALTFTEFSQLKPHLLESAQISQTDALKIADMSGGIVKVATNLPGSTQSQSDQIVADLAGMSGKVSFSVIDESNTLSLHDIKVKLTKLGRRSRFQEINSLHDSAASLSANHHEYWLLSGQKEVYKVIWTQNIKSWAKRDFSRPFSDPKSGMLPPKIARIMINLALSGSKNATVYDPFCGSGTILAESLALGYDTIGSDQSLKAVEESTANVKWLSGQLNPSPSYQIFQSDATQVKSDHLNKTPDAIVFEPYLGPPRIRPEKLDNIVRGLEKLYLGSLKNLGKLIPAGKKVVCILPKFNVENRVKNTADLIDRCEKLGYTLMTGPLEYSRPHAVVIRQIFVLEKVA